MFTKLDIHFLLHSAKIESSVFVSETFLDSPFHPCSSGDCDQ